MQVLTFPERSTPEPFRKQVVALVDQVWPSKTDLPVTHRGHDPALTPLSMVLVHEDTVLAALDILFKQIQHAGDSYRAAGLSRVVSRTETRRSGNGRRLVCAAHDAMTKMHIDVGLFTCDRELRGFYTSARWQELDGTVLVGGTPDDPFPSDQRGFDKVTMGDFFSPHAQSNAPLFRGARIALYPGQIDKLW